MLQNPVVRLRRAGDYRRRVSGDRMTLG